MQKLYNCEAKRAEKSLEDSSDEEDNEENANPSPESEEYMPQISLAAIKGIAQPHTLKLKGHIKKKNFIILVDSRRYTHLSRSQCCKKTEHFVLPSNRFKSYGSRWETYRWSRKVP